MKKGYLLILSLLSISIGSHALTVNGDQLKLVSKCQSLGPARSNFVSPKLAGKMIFVNLYSAPNNRDTSKASFVAVIQKSQDMTSHRADITQFAEIVRQGQDLTSARGFTFKSGYSSGQESSVKFVFDGGVNHIAVSCRSL